MGLGGRGEGGEVVDSGAGKAEGMAKMEMGKSYLFESWILCVIKYSSGHLDKYFG